MKTTLLYLSDPYQKEIDTTISSFEKVNEKEYKIILNETIFYPFGGGQSTDQGILEFENGIKGEVYQVLLQQGEVWHYVKFAENTEITEGMKLHGVIDWARRFKHMQIHSAGHIIDFAIHALGLTPSILQPLKGDHGKKPFISYSGTINAQEYQQKILEKSNELIDQNKSFTWEFVDKAELEKTAIYLQPGLPENKPLRKLTLEGIGSVADGGTIVAKTSEVPHVEITNIVIDTNQNTTTIHYQLSNIENDQLTKNQKQNKENVFSSKTNQFSAYIDEVHLKIAAMKTEPELTQLWREYLGKEGIVSELLKKIKEVKAEDRKTFGQDVNLLKNEIDTLINNAKATLLESSASEYLNQKQGTIGYKTPKIGHYHPLTETINQINGIFYRLGYSVYDGPELETDEYLFQRCNLPEHHPARDLQDSIFIEEPNILMRTQTSSVEARALENLKPPFKIVVPGRAYRNEKVNKSNHFLFHQYQLVCVQEKVTLADLFATINHMFKSLYGPDVIIRFRNKYYPEVEPGVGADMQCPFCKGEGCVVCKKRGWLEMAGAGIIHPNMMRMAGLDTAKWQGFAFGFGLDRLAMTKHGIQDVRVLLGGNLAYRPFVK